mgnify:CR=1 FL=1
MKKVLFILLASVLSFGSAQAVDVSVGISMNQSVFAATGKEDNYSETGASGGSIVTEEYGAFKDSYPSIFVEVGLNESFSIGLSAQSEFGTPENTNERCTSHKANCNSAGETTPTSKVSADFESYFTVYGKVNIPLGGLYVKGGLSRVDITVNETQASGNTYPDTDTTGYMVAIGYQFDAATGVSLRAEIQGHSFDDVEVNNGKSKSSGNYNSVTVSDMIGATGTISLVKTF